MANRSTEIGRIMRAGDTELARRRVRNAIRKAEGNVTAAARILNVEENTIDRWVFRLALEDDLAEARAQRHAKSRAVRREQRRLEREAERSRVHSSEHGRIVEK